MVLADLVHAIASSRLSREPLVWFLLLGAALFLFPLAAARGRGTPARERIVIAASAISVQREAFRRTWLREPTQDELDALIRKTADDEMLAREAVAMGIDRDDAIVRRRLRQKLESAIEGSARVTPSEQDLETFRRSRADRYTVDARVSFQQVFLSPQLRGDRVARDAAGLLADLRAGRAGNAASLGDGTLLPAELRDVTPREIENVFGRELAAEIARTPIGEWTGPFSSGYGLHLLRVEARTPGRPATLAEARDHIRRDWESQRSREAIDAYYAGLEKKYAVVVEPREGRRASGERGAR